MCKDEGVMMVNGRTCDDEEVEGGEGRRGKCVMVCVDEYKEEEKM